MIVTIRQTEQQDALNAFAARHHDLMVSFLNAETILGSIAAPAVTPDTFDMAFRMEGDTMIVDSDGFGGARLHPQKSWIGGDPLIVQSADRQRQYRISRYRSTPKVAIRSMWEIIKAHEFLADHFEEHPRIAGFIIEMSPADEMTVSLTLPYLDYATRPGPALIQSIRFVD